MTVLLLQPPFTGRRPKCEPRTAYSRVDGTGQPTNGAIGYLPRAAASAAGAVVDGRWPRLISCHRSETWLSDLKRRS